MNILVNIAKKAQAITSLILPSWMLLSITIKLLPELQKIGILDYALILGALASFWGIGIWIIASLALMFFKEFSFDNKVIVFLVFLIVLTVSVLTADGGPTNARELF